MSALPQRAAIVQRKGVSATVCISRRAQRRDTLVASAVLVLLLAGWMLNFFSLKQLTHSLGSYVAYVSAHQV